MHHVACSCSHTPRAEACTDSLSNALFCGCGPFLVFQFPTGMKWGTAGEAVLTISINNWELIRDSDLPMVFENCGFMDHWIVTYVLVIKPF